MRSARLVRPDITATYSICARVVDGLFKFSRKFKDEMLKLLYDVADFCGVSIIDFCFMSNHFHIEVRVPPKDTFVPDKEVIRRVGILYTEEERLALERAVDFYNKAGNEAAIKELLAPYRARMNDLSMFMKTYMQRVTMKYNKFHKRVGTLWQGRFRSTLVEHTSNLDILRKIAAYFDLNPLRAGMVDDPGKYPWCSYGLACGRSIASKRAKEGLALLYPDLPALVFMKKYRRLLHARFAKKGMNQKKDVSGNPELDFSVRQPRFTAPRVIGSMEFVLRSLGKLPKRGVVTLAGGYVAVGGERRHLA